MKEIAGLLEEKDAIPMVREQMALIQDVQTDEWWQDVTVPMLETMRRRLRDLVQFIDKRQRKPVYTDFEDLIGGETDVDAARLRASAPTKPSSAPRRGRSCGSTWTTSRSHKLRMNKPLTASDLAELERMLAESGVGRAGGHPPRRG